MPNESFMMQKDRLNMVIEKTCDASPLGESIQDAIRKNTKRPIWVGVEAQEDSSQDPGIGL